MTKSVKQRLKESKIDFTNFYIGIDNFDYFDYKNDFFDINPEEYLLFAKEDYKDKSRRGKINAVTNAKRAIDCQTELILKLLGFDSVDSLALFCYPSTYFDSAQ